MDTRIFARLAGSEQFLIYSMKLSVAGSVAMILPVPVVAGGGDHALRFVDLSSYPTLFDDLDAAFPIALEPQSRGGLVAASAPKSRPKLIVHRVGAFEASYVPSRTDFDRLEPRFRLPDSVWAAMTGYADWGFAVFQLARARKQTIQPMAFRFDTRAPDRLFFPTVHVHDGIVHDTARFSHQLYYQHPDITSGDELTTLHPFNQVWQKIDQTAGLVTRDEPLARRTLRGELPNRDTWIEPSTVERDRVVA
jgi:hypothetical protein